MPVIVRDAVAADHLVYAWPFPLGPEEHEVACGDDERVVMCPAWVVGGLLGPGRHRWRTPDPTRPVSIYFVLAGLVEVSFDLVTMFTVPSSGQQVRIHAAGSLQVKCSDPALLIAQFVGLPFDNINDGVLRSVARSVERMLARLLVRRVVLAGTPAAIDDPAALQNILEELVAYNPAAGAVFGVELARMGHLAIQVDDGTRPLPELGAAAVSRIDREADTQRGISAKAASAAAIPLLETVRAPRPASVPPVEPPTAPAPAAAPPAAAPQATSSPPVIPPGPPTPPGAVPAPAPPPPGPPVRPSQPSLHSTQLGHAAAPSAPQQTTKPSNPPPIPSPRKAAPVEVPRAPDEITEPGVPTPVPATKPAATTPPPGSIRVDSETSSEVRGSILGIGMAHIGSSGVATGEIPQKVEPGGRVLVPGPNGLMQSATVRQLLRGYYELEVGGSGETIWVPVNGVVPE